MRADRRHGHGKHGHAGAGGSMTLINTINPPLPRTSLDAYATMLGWAQQPGAPERLHSYYEGHHHADPLDLRVAV